MKIERHIIDDEFLKDMKDRTERIFNKLSASIDASRRDPKNLYILINRTTEFLACCSVVEPRSPRIASVLTLGADASAALFAAAEATPQSPVTVRLGESGPVTYTSMPDQSTLSVSEWITGFYLTALDYNVEATQSLCRTPMNIVRRSTTQGADYLYLYMEALQLYGNSKAEGLINKILAAIHATDPNRPDIVDVDWTLYLHVPQLEVLMYVVTRDAKFGGALAKAVDLHKRYWSKSKERRRDYSGYISIELTALAGLGMGRGLSFDIESPYIAMHLIG